MTSSPYKHGIRLHSLKVSTISRTKDGSPQWKCEFAPNRNSRTLPGSRGPRNGKFYARSGARKHLFAPKFAQSAFNKGIDPRDLANCLAAFLEMEGNLEVGIFASRCTGQMAADCESKRQFLRGESDMRKRNKEALMGNFADGVVVQAPSFPVVTRKVKRIRTLSSSTWGDFGSGPHVFAL